MKTKINVKLAVCVLLVLASVATHIYVIVLLTQSSNTMSERLSAVEHKVNSFQPHQINIPENMQEEMVNNLSIKNGRALKDLTSAIDKLKNERSQKAEIYLSEARSSVQKAEIAQILYVSALAYADDKAEILSEYITWQTELIKQDLEDKNIANAQERLIMLAGICDTNIASGSINDMNSIPVLKEKLIVAEQLITSTQEQLVKSQESKLNDLTTRFDSLNPYSDNILDNELTAREVEKLLKELTALTVDPSLDTPKDELVAKIILKQTYLTLPTEPLMIPTIGEDTPWNEWLKNFIVRLKSPDLTITKKLEDLGTAADFLQAAKSSNAEGVQEVIEKLEKVSRGIYLSYWKERVERITTFDDRNLNEISTLLAECNAFSSEEQKENIVHITKLNKYITAATLDEYAEGLKILKALENSVADETYMQMIGATQGQYIQLLLRLKALDAKFENQFSTEISDATQKIAHLGNLLNGYKNESLATDMEKNEKRRKRFIKRAKYHLNSAKDSYEQGEAIARQWMKTRSSKEAVAKYRDAWRMLMQIHPNDLHTADPALYQDYQEWKTRLENHWQPTDEDRKSINYIRMSGL